MYLTGNTATTCLWERSCRVRKMHSFSPRPAFAIGLNKARFSRLDALSSLWYEPLNDGKPVSKKERGIAYPVARLYLSTSLFFSFSLYSVLHLRVLLTRIRRPIAIHPDEVGARARRVVKNSFGNSSASISDISTLIYREGFLISPGRSKPRLRSHQRRRRMLKFLFHALPRLPRDDCHHFLFYIFVMFLSIFVRSFFVHREFSLGIVIFNITLNKKISPSLSLVIKKKPFFNISYRR